MNKKLLLCFILTSINIFPAIILTLNDKEQVLNIAKEFLPKDPHILEAGAFDGTDTVFMKNFWPKSTIYSFEPVPEAYNWLIEKTKNIDNIYCFELALSDKIGSQTFFLSEAHDKPGVTLQSGSLLAPKEHLNYAPHIAFKNKIIVPTTTIDKWAETFNVDKIDMLWLDLQGIELNVLKESPKILYRVSVIYTEVEFVEAYENQSLYEEMKNFMKSNGFIEYAKNFNIPGKDGWEWFGDVMFVKESLIS